MKGDFTRDTFDPKKHYSGVLMQQGRVQMDADWNEMGDILTYLDETARRDIIGASGTPKDNPGFGLSVDAGNSLVIGAGRYYVDGILCQNEAAVTWAGQPDYPGGLFPAADGTYMVYLDVWKRHITALEDADIREVALGGPDTGTRVKTMWQVRTMPIPKSASLREILGSRLQSLKSTVDKMRSPAVVRGWGKALTLISNDISGLQSMSQPVENDVISVLDTIHAQLNGLHTPKNLSASAKTKATQFIRKTGAMLDQVKASVISYGLEKPGCNSSVSEWSALVAEKTARLCARSQPGGASDPCLIAPGAGYRRLENQLYRVEIHQGGTAANARFKWSRDNASTCTNIIGEVTGGTQISVHDLGRDTKVGFVANCWVEVVDQETELQGKVSQLAQVASTKPDELAIVLTSAVTVKQTDASGKPLNPRARRWDSGLLAVVNSADPGEWIELEDGVQVQFDAGATYNAGDYWLIPARTATGDVEWPVDTLNAPIPQPPHGIYHHYCRLGIISIHDKVIKVTEDCRQLFCPLVANKCCVATAVHVVRTSWENDDQFDYNEFVKNGIKVTFDAKIDRGLFSDPFGTAPMIVSAEIPSSETAPRISQQIVLNGRVHVVKNDPGDPDEWQTIVWKWNSTPPAATPADTGGVRPGTTPAPGPAAGLTLDKFLASMMNASAENVRGVTIKAVQHPKQAAVARVRVTLKGHVLWSSQGRRLLYLDGQAFGIPVRHSYREQVRIGLRFPTGNNQCASDFESWFYLEKDVPQPQPKPVLQVAGVKFLDKANDVVAEVKDHTQSTVTINKPVSIVQVIFTRAVKTDGLNSPVGKPQSIIVQRSQGEMFGPITMIDAVTAQYTMQDPNEIRSGRGALTVVGIPKENAPAVTALDDGQVLDGNFDNNPGGDYVLEFIVSG